MTNFILQFICIPIKFNLNIQMGAVCENVSIEKHPLGEDVSATRFTRYQTCEWPKEDEYFNSKLEDLKQKEEGFNDFIANKLMKLNKDNNEYYVGQWDITGYPRGKGVMYRPSEVFYYGSFDQTPHGEGYLDNLKDQYTYQGTFNHGKIQGHGKYAQRNNVYVYQGVINSESQPTTGKLVVNLLESESNSYVVHLNDYPHNKAKIQYNDGRVYEGYLNLSTFVPQGEGAATFPGNIVYEGEWLHGEFHGKGRFTWSNGSQYFGDYKEGKKHGQGKFTYPSKKYYYGGWQNGKQNGQGTLFDQEGNVIKKGMWKDGEFHSAQ